MHISTDNTSRFEYYLDFDYKFYMGYNSGFNEPAKVWNADLQIAAEESGYSET